MNNPLSNSSSVHPNVTTTVRVRLFSTLREMVGESTLDVTVAGAATGTTLLDQLASEYPDIGNYRPFLRIAVNERYADVDVQLSDGDEVALITPVSGG